MKLDKVYIDDFRQFKKFKIDLNELGTTTVFMGHNGTGKSNLLEFIANAFIDIISNIPSKNGDFQLQYYVGKSIIYLESKNSKYIYKLNGKKASRTVIVDFFPEHVFAYYSGVISRLENTFTPFQKRFARNLREEKNSGLRQFFYLYPHHVEPILLTYLIYGSTLNYNLLEKEIGIKKFSKIRLVLKRPYWSNKKIEDSNFFGAIGTVAKFLEQLTYFAIKKKKNQDEEIYEFDARDIVLIKKNIKKATDFFKLIEDTYEAGLVERLEVFMALENKTEIPISQLSEGQCQLLSVIGMLEFVNKKNILVLLDEPETHLNPIWKYNYMAIIGSAIGTQNSCHVLATTHDPILISGLEKEDVFILYKDENTQITHCKMAPKDIQGMGVDAILTSELFGLNTTIDKLTYNKMLSRRELFAKATTKNLTESEQVELRKLTKELELNDYALPLNNPEYLDFIKAMKKLDMYRIIALNPEEKERREKHVFKIMKNIKEKYKL